MITDKGDYFEYYGGAVKTCVKESNDQVNFIAWQRFNYPNMLVFHPVNEGKKTITAALLDQQSGLLKGASDVIIMHRSARYPFGAIELKRQGKTQASPVSSEQKAFLSSVREAGGFAAVAYGFEQAKLAFMDFLKEHE